jgi:hypothetical protein
MPPKRKRIRRRSAKAVKSPKRRRRRSKTKKAIRNKRIVKSGGAGYTPMINEEQVVPVPVKVKEDPAANPFGYPPKIEGDASGHDDNETPRRSNPFHNQMILAELKAKIHDKIEERCHEKTFQLDEEDDDRNKVEYDDEVNDLRNKRTQILYNKCIEFETKKLN